MISLFLLGSFGAFAQGTPSISTQQAVTNTSSHRLQNNSIRTYIFPVCRIGWNISAVQLTLLKKGFLPEHYGLYLEYDVDFTGPNGFHFMFDLLLASKWMIEKGLIVLAPLGRPLIYLHPGDVIRWTFLYMRYVNVDADGWFSGIAVGVVAQKVLEPAIPP